MLQQAADELGLPRPSSVVSSTDVTTRQLLAISHRVGDELRSRFGWPELVREHTITLVDSQANYAMPSDYDSQHFETHWDLSNDWEIIGPMSPSEWQYLQNSGVVSIPRRRWRIKGSADRQFYVSPTPSAGDAGQELKFEYQSTTWIKPVTWTTGASFSANTYCWFNGNIYSTASGGTTGATPPTHTSSSASDGGVTWAYVSAAYKTFLADTDTALLDEDLVILGIKWRFMLQKGLQYEEYKAEFEAHVQRQITALSGARSLSTSQSNGTYLLSLRNIPDGNWSL